MPFPPSAPARFEASTQAPNGSDIVGQHDDTQRDHPEAYDGQETDNTEQDQQNARSYSNKSRTRQRKLPPEEVQTFRRPVAIQM